MGDIHEGESVLDIGCGTGVDAMIAATMVGPAGRVVGVEMSSEMVEKANQNIARRILTDFLPRVLCRGLTIA